MRRLSHVVQSVPLPVRQRVLYSALAALLTLVTWPFLGPAQPYGLVPAAGLDQSWIAALHMGTNQSLAYGDPIVFTYGPLGFLHFPMFWYSNTALLGIVAQTMLRFLLAFALIEVLRPRLGLFIAATGAWVALLINPEPLVPVILFVAAISLLELPTQRKASLFAVGGGLAVGLEMLGKVSVGITAAMLVAATVVMLPSHKLRMLCTAAVSTLLSLLAGWLATGNSLGALPGYLRGIADISSSYSEAMLTEAPTTTYQYGLALVVTAIGYMAAWQTGHSGERNRRLHIVVLWTLFAFLAFKQGFVRHDDSHALIYFGILTVALMAFPWKRDQSALAVTSVAVGLCVVLSIGGYKLSEFASPTRHVDAARHPMRLMVSHERRSEIAALGRTVVAAALALPESYQKAIRGRPTAVLPSELSAIWLAGAELSPIATLQSYAGYSAALDDLNTDSLRAQSGPDFVLFRSEKLPDGRLFPFDSPGVARELLCGFRAERQAQAPWVLLSRTANRCTARPEIVKSARLAWGQRIGVPEPSSPRSFVYVKIEGAEVRGGERLRSLLYKPHTRTLYTGNKPHGLPPRHGCAWSGRESR